MKPKTRARWNGETWVPRTGLVVHSRQMRSPEEIAGEVSRMITENRLTEVVMIGETAGRGVAKCYTWMIPSRRLWFAKQLEFHAMHGRFPNEDAEKGAPV